MLLDAAQIERFSVWIPPIKVITAMASVFREPPQAPDHFNVTPHLAEISDPEKFWQLAYRLAQCSASHGAMTWLVSPLPLAELTTRLRLRLDARLPDNFDCINRYYDGRVLPHLHACLTDAQRDAFFSLAEQWWFVSPAFEWQSLPCRWREADSFTAPLELDAKQEAHLIDACYPYAVIEHFERSDPELLDSLPPLQRYGFMREALRAAANFGIEDSEAILFCTLAMTRGADFYKEAAWANGLKSVQQGKATLSDVLKAQHAE